MNTPPDNNFSQLVTFFWVIALSAWGGIVSYLHKVEKLGLRFSLIKLAAEIFTSGFVGVMTFLLCDAAKLSWEVSAALVGVSGHMGTRALFILENKYSKYFGADE